MADFLIARIHEHLFESRSKVKPGSNLPEPFTYKEYSRMPRIPLPPPAINASLSQVFASRRSSNHPQKSAPLSLQTLSDILSGLAIRMDSSRPYPSGGALYPIETYIVGSVEDRAPGVFHYHPSAHTLEDLWPIPKVAAIQDMFIPASTDEPPPGTLVFTAQWRKTAPKYGEFAYILALIEAGHMAQNVLLAAASAGVAARPVAGLNQKIVESILDIDSPREQPIYSIKLWGQIAP